MDTQETQRRQRQALLLIAGGALLVLAAMAWIFWGSSLGTAGDSDLPYPEVERIPVDEAWALIQGGEAVVLDVRGPDNYQAAHIPSAVSMPSDEVQVRHQELSKDLEILTYCT